MLLLLVDGKKLNIIRPLNNFYVTRVVYIDESSSRRFVYTRESSEKRVNRSEVELETRPRTFAVKINAMTQAVGDL
ncbi:hypothetical protein QTP88_024468 [Uroleucon formosanum]